MKLCECITSREWKNCNIKEAVEKFLIWNFPYGDIIELENDYEFDSNEQEIEFLKTLKTEINNIIDDFISYRQ